jgi:hypothetical protein
MGKNKKRAFKFKQHKPRLADPNPPTHVSVWFKMTHPDGRMANDNFKSEDALDDYLGLIDNKPSRSEPEFARPAPNRFATHYPEKVMGRADPTVFQESRIISNYSKSKSFSFPVTQTCKKKQHEDEDKELASQNPRGTPEEKSSGWVTYDYENDEYESDFITYDYEEEYSRDYPRKPYVYHRRSFPTHAESVLQRRDPALYDYHYG